jgi:hypothetical protein
VPIRQTTPLQEQFTSLSVCLSFYLLTCPGHSWAVGCWPLLGARAACLATTKVKPSPISVSPPLLSQCFWLLTMPSSRQGRHEHTSRARHEQATTVAAMPDECSSFNSHQLLPSYSYRWRLLRTVLVVVVGVLAFPLTGKFLSLFSKQKEITNEFRWQCRNVCILFVELGCFRVIFSGVGYPSVRIPACLCRQIQRMCYATRTRTLPLTWYVHAHACGINKFSKPSPSLVNSFFYPIWFWPCMQVYTNTHMRAPISYSSDRTLYLIPSVCTSFLRLGKGNFDNRYCNDSLDHNQDGWICSSRLITL